jgi:hypothetical protein
MAGTKDEMRRAGVILTGAVVHPASGGVSALMAAPMD